MKAKDARQCLRKFLPTEVPLTAQMKKCLPLLLALLAILSPLRVLAAAGDLYESDFNTGTILQFATTASGTVVKLTFATGLTGVRGLDRGVRRAFSLIP